MYAEKLVSVPQSHKIEYVPMHTIRDIARLATMLAGLIAPRIRLGFVSTSSRLCLDYASPTPRLRLDFDLLRALSLVTQTPSLCAQAHNILFPKLSKILIIFGKDKNLQSFFHLVCENQISFAIFYFHVNLILWVPCGQVNYALPVRIR